MESPRLTSSAKNARPEAPRRRGLPDPLPPSDAAEQRGDHGDRRRSEEQYRPLFEAHPIAMWVFDRETLRVLAANDAAVAGYGYTREEFLTLSIADLRPPQERPHLERALRARPDGEHRAGVFTHRRKDGSTLWADVTSQPVTFAGRAGRLVTALDVTDRRDAEEQLRQNHALLQAVTEGIGDALYVKDRAGRYLLVNSAGARAIGKAPEEIIGRDDADLFPPETARQTRAHDERVLASGRRETYEDTEPEAGGRTYLSSKGVYRDARGEIAGVFGISHDITTRKRAEEELCRAEAKYRAIFENAVEGIFQSRPGGGFLGVNPALAQMLGYDSPAELLAAVSDVGTQVYADPEERAGMLRLFATQGMVSGYELQVRCKSGATLWVSLTARAVWDERAERVLHIEGRAVDITGRRQAEEALRMSEARFRSAFDDAPMGICLTDAAGRYLQVNRALCDLVGYSEAEMMAGGFSEITHPDDLEADLQQHRQVLDGSRDSYAMEKRYLHKSGRIVWVSLSVSAVRAPDGQTPYIIAQVHDITQRRALEAERLQAQERLRLRDRAITAASNGIVIADPNQPDSPLVYCNPAFLALTGYTESEVLGHNCRFLQGPDTDEEAVRRMREALRTGAECRTVLRNYKKDGTPFWNELTISPVRDADGRVTHFIGIQTDVTARKELEAERERAMRQAQEQADRDPLTGLLNHRAFHKRLGDECRRAEGTGLPVAVVMMDLDNFKFFNDAYGHPVGDDVLQRVAGGLRAGVRLGDTVARFGGDEFALILPGLDAGGAAALVRRVCACVGDAGYRPEGYDVAVPIALSAGIAVWPHDGGTHLAALEGADERLRRHKSGAEDQRADDIRTRMGQSLEGFSMLDALVTAVDNKDRYTRRHSEDVLAYSLEIAGGLGLDERTRQTVAVAALLHDVGKIGVPDRVLRKPGKLTDEEFAAVQNHPMMGAVIVAAVPGLEDTLDAIRHHHERWDGGGYPFGLRGPETPLIARLMAVADAFSAMTTDRPYRKGMGEAKALSILRDGAGTQWDPQCVAAFLRARRADLVQAA